jgi:hypothetical protein
VYVIRALAIFTDLWNVFVSVLGPNVKTAVAILKCLLARQLCFEDASCSAILEIIPRVCGSELGEYTQFLSRSLLPIRTRRVHSVLITFSFTDQN